MRRSWRNRTPPWLAWTPSSDYIPEHIRSASLREVRQDPGGRGGRRCSQFNKGLIDALCDVVPAVKPQAAYYEMYGWQGVKALHETIAYAQEQGHVRHHRRQAQRHRRHHDRPMPPPTWARRGGGRGDLRALRRGRPDGQRLPGHRRHPAPAGGVRQGGQGHLRAGEDLQSLLR